MMKKFATIGVCAVILLGTAMPVSAKGGGGGTGGRARRSRRQQRRQQRCQ
jgi:hypothetical protein